VVHFHSSRQKIGPKQEEEEEEEEMDVPNLQK
jgi:hypothetical protein